MNPRTTRTAGRAGVLAFLATVLLAPSVAQAATAPTVSVTGTYTLVHVDGTVGHPGADGFRQELRTPGRTLDVSLPADTAFRSGDTVQLSGRVEGDTLKVARSHVQSFAPDTVTVAGTTRVLVVLAEWGAPDATTPSTAAGVFDADSAWFQQSSYGHLSLSTTVTSWVHVRAPAAGLCSDSSVSDQLTDRAVAAAGYNAEAFDRVVVYFPTSTDPSCTEVAGFAEAPGNRVWLNGVMDVRTTVHEQGHNYGLYHAHSATCREPGSTVPTAAPDPAADNCDYVDYGDPYDAMGASGYAADYSASQKAVLGWLDAGRAATLPVGGSVGLVPYEQQSGAVHAASFAAGGRTYWFENRSATGPDAQLPPGATGGVLVHVDDPGVDAASGEASSWAPAQTYLLDQSPADGYAGTAVLAYGQSWTSPEGVTFSVGAPDGGTVSVSASAVATAPASTPAPVVPLLRFASGRTTQTVTEDGSVRLAGTVRQPDGTPAVGAIVVLQSSPHGRDAWRTVQSWAVPASGLLSTTVRARASSDYRLAVPASPSGRAATSGRLSLVVRPIVLAAVSRTTVVRGRTVRLDVSIPGHPGQLVRVQRWAHGAWHPLLTVRLSGDARRTVTVRAIAKGLLRYRFVKAPDRMHLGAASRALRVRVV